MRHRWLSWWAPTMLGLLAITAASSLEGRVNVICFGDVVDQYGGFNSFVVIRNDPAIDATLVPSRPDYLGSQEAAWRNMRIYMPRTYARLTQDYDLILTSDADRTIFRTEWIDWLGRSVTDEGLGLLWLGSIQSNSFESWEGTTLADIAPCEPGQDLDVSGSFKVKVLDSSEPLMAALPWQEAPALANVNSQVAKQGSSLWARMVHPKEYPLMTYWGIGSGRVLCFASKFPNGVLPWTRGWAFFPEAMIYLTYRTAERALPQDVLLFRQLITDFLEYEERRSMAASVIGFVEQFGGRTDRLFQRFDDAAQMKAGADAAYLAGDYERCLDIMREVKADQLAMMEDAMKAKDSALLWVYITEWCALTATIMVSGLVVWGLMVRRRLYREVGSSRLPRS